MMYQRMVKISCLMLSCYKMHDMTDFKKNISKYKFTKITGSKLNDIIYNHNISPLREKIILQKIMLDGENLNSGLNVRNKIELYFTTNDILKKVQHHKYILDIDVLHDSEIFVGHNIFKTDKFIIKNLKSL